MPTRLEAIKRRLAATTPGPWQSSIGSIGIPDPDGEGFWVELRPQTESGPAYHRDAEANADFIAHARADIEALLRVARAAQMLKRKMEGSLLVPRLIDLRPELVEFYEALAALAAEEE